MEPKDVIISYVGLQECYSSSSSLEGQCQTWTISSLHYINNFIWTCMLCVGFVLNVLCVSTIIILLIRKVWSLTIQLTYTDRAFWMVMILGYFFRMAIISRSLLLNIQLFGGYSNGMALQQHPVNQDAVLGYPTRNSDHGHWNAHHCFTSEYDNCFCNEIKKLLLQLAVSNEEKFIWHNQNNGSYSCINDSISHRVYMQESLDSYETGLSLIVFADICFAIYTYWIAKDYMYKSSQNSKDKYDETLISV